MIKIKYFLAGIALITMLTGCGDDNNNNNIKSFDYAGQALKDNDTLVNFLKNHYYDTKENLVKPLEKGKIALFSDSKLKTKTITQNDIDYDLYVYVNKVGTPVPKKGSPTVADSVFVNYTGKTIVNATKLNENNFDSRKNIWFVLSQVIRGWSYGFPYFKGGENVTQENEPLTYINGGNGVLFIPSGLAYGNKGSAGIGANQNLMFYIELLDVKENTDIDGDGVPSILEDLNEDDILTNDDTDKDGVPNYLDTDDDGDGALTKDEDANKDGDPRNDFSDPNNSTIPDYLNLKIR